MVLLPGVVLWRGLAGAWLGPALAAIALWLLPESPSRSMVVGLGLVVLLFGGLVVSTLRDRRLTSESADPFSVHPATLLAFALGLQFLLRSSSWLAATPPAELALRPLVTWLVLPAATVALIWWLGQRWSMAEAAPATLAAVLLAGGMTVTVILALSALAAIDLARDATVRPLARFAAIAVLVGVVALGPARGILLVIGATVLFGRRGWPAAVLVGAGLLAVMETSRPWAEVVGELPLLFLTVPFPVGAWSVAGIRGSVARRRRPADLRRRGRAAHAGIALHSVPIR